MTPVFSSELLLGLLRAAAKSEVEICGILRARGARIVRADPAANVAADPARHFEIDPAALLGAYRDARTPGAADIAGWYHSHPGGRPDPSPTDAARADPDGRLWLILGHGVARLWRAVADGAVHGRFDPVRFAIADDRDEAENAKHIEKSRLAVQMDPTGRTLSSVRERDMSR